MPAKPGEPMAFLKALINVMTDECIIWPFARFKNGYPNLAGFSAIRIMCQMRHGEPPSPAYDTAHSCGRGGDGCINPNHLRWATKKENQADRITHGTSCHTLLERNIDGRFLRKRENANR